MVLQSTPDVLNGASLSLNSYAGHNFEVRELPAKKTMECGGEEKQCRIDRFTVKSTQDQGELLQWGAFWCHIFGGIIIWMVRCSHADGPRMGRMIVWELGVDTSCYLQAVLSYADYIGCAMPPKHLLRINYISSLMYCTHRNNKS